MQQKSDSYKEKKEKINFGTTCGFLTKRKQDENFAWLKDVSSTTLHQSLRDLEKAFTNFFAGRARYPKFKNKSSRQSVRYTKSGFTFSDGILRIAKNKAPLDVRWSRKFVGDPISITISKDCAGRYHVSFTIKEPVNFLPKVKRNIGIDVGIKDICVTSEGFKSGAPKYTRKHEKRLANRQRILSRKVKGSKNRAKARLRAAKVHSKIADCRCDFNNKLTTKLIRENQAIAVESLNIKGMQNNKRLSKSIADASWGDFLRKLKYKALWYGRELIEIDKWFPSSKTCSCCGAINRSLMLQDRNWQCSCCRETLDRDINAAINILTAGGGEWVGGCRGSPLEIAEDSATIICCKAAFSELGIPWH